MRGAPVGGRGRVGAPVSTLTRVSTPRDELRELVEHLPDEQVPAVLSELRARLAPAAAGRSWPPAWFGIAEGSAPDVSERVEEILAEGLGRRPA